jgi:hypothetical protein
MEFFLITKLTLLTRRRILSATEWDPPRRRGDSEAGHLRLCPRGRAVC